MTYQSHPELLWGLFYSATLSDDVTALVRAIGRAEYSFVDVTWATQLRRFASQSTSKFGWKRSNLLSPQCCINLSNSYTFHCIHFIPWIHTFSRWNTRVLCEVIQSDELLVPEHIDQRYMVIPTERMTECLWHFTTRERNEEFKAVTWTYMLQNRRLSLYPFSSSFSLEFCWDSNGKVPSRNLSIRYLELLR